MDRTRAALKGVAMMLPLGLAIAGIVVFGERGRVVHGDSLLSTLGGGVAAIAMPVFIILAVLGLTRVIGALRR